ATTRSPPPRSPARRGRFTETSPDPWTVGSGSRGFLPKAFRGAGVRRMGRPESGRRRGVPVTSVIGAGAGALTVAALVAALQTGVPAASGAALSATSRSIDADESSAAAGPLQIPNIGVVAPGFD